MNSLEDIDDKEFGKAAYAHSLVMETMLVKIITQTALSANPDNPAEAVDNMRANMAGLWKSKTVQDDAGNELMALMQHYSDNFWDQVKISAAMPAGSISAKN